MTTTAADITREVIEILDGVQAKYDVSEIVAQLIQTYHLTGPHPSKTLADVPTTRFYKIVCANAL